ncbi:transposase [Paraburkholderia sediminicola]|uniref:transposase n=1 Tax=Paraburkholderia sediminicola TaxID=458836 RepID=UPI0038BA4502
MRTPNHPIEFRRELAKLACEPGVSVARLALEHGLNTNLLFKWRRAYQAGQYEPPTLLPVELVHEERTIGNAAALPVQSSGKHAKAIIPRRPLGSEVTGSLTLGLPSWLYIWISLPSAGKKVLASWTAK